MNRRQAKIEALLLASGILDGTGIDFHLPEEDQEKIEEEFRKLAERLYERAHRLIKRGSKP